MMKQYLEMKDRSPDSILFFRLGDFYEMFFDDAKLASKELDLTLTTRDRNKPPEERTPMCGVPYHSCDSYIATPATATSPGSSPRGTRWPSASRPRTRPPPRGW